MKFLGWNLCVFRCVFFGVPCFLFNSPTLGPFVLPSQSLTARPWKMVGKEDDPSSYWGWVHFSGSMFVKRREGNRPKLRQKIPWTPGRVEESRKVVGCFWGGRFLCVFDWLKPYQPLLNPGLFSDYTAYFCWDFFAFFWYWLIDFEMSLGKKPGSPWTPFFICWFTNLL